MIRTALVGLGKMGLSHMAMFRAHPEINLVAICDTTGYVLDVLNKYTGVQCYSDFNKMLAELELDALIVVTPSRFHGDMVRAALERGLHVFCEKPFTLSPELSTELAALAASKGLVNQVGYHFRFVGAFKEMKRIVDSGLLGELHHVRAEAYGPVVLRSKSSTWRSSKQEGGGSLYDYACHAIDLVNYMVGAPKSVSGAVLNSVFSSDVDDEVYATLHFSERMHGQLSVNWSDESFRKMTTRLTIFGTAGKIYADRQEVQIYLREAPDPSTGLQKGWNVRYTTELTEEVWFYLRGEEYSAQVTHFVDCIKGKVKCISSFSSAAEADKVASWIARASVDKVNIGEDSEAGVQQSSDLATANPFFRVFWLILRSIKQSLRVNGR